MTTARKFAIGERRDDTGCGAPPAPSQTKPRTSGAQCRPHEIVLEVEQPSPVSTRVRTWSSVIGRMPAAMPSRRAQVGGDVGQRLAGPEPARALDMAWRGRGRRA